MTPIVWRVIIASLFCAVGFALCRAMRMRPSSWRRFVLLAAGGFWLLLTVWVSPMVLHLGRRGWHGPIVAPRFPLVTRAALEADLGSPRKAPRASADGTTEALYRSGWMTYEVTFRPSESPSSARIASVTVTIAKRRLIPGVGGGGVTCDAPEDALMMLGLAPGHHSSLRYPPYRVSESPTRVEFREPWGGFSSIAVTRPGPSGPWQQVLLEIAPW